MFVYHFQWDHRKIIRLINRLSLVDGRLSGFSEYFLLKVVEFQPDQQTEDKQSRRKADPEDWTTSLEPRVRFDKWKYQEILEKGVRPLSEREPYRATRILIDATATMIRLQFHQDELEEGGSNDHSTLWCRRVNESSRHYQDSREALVLALSFACEKVYEKAPESVAALDQALRNQRWDIFIRIRQHLYALHHNNLSLIHI